MFKNKTELLSLVIWHDSRVVAIVDLVLTKRGNRILLTKARKTLDSELFSTINRRMYVAASWFANAKHGVVSIVHEVYKNNLMV